MSWCDKLASTPTVGVFLNPYYTPGEHILAALGSKLATWHGDEAKPPFQINQAEPFVVGVQVDDGFGLHFEPTKVNVSFQHKLRLVPTSGGPPVARLLSKPEPYTELLSRASDLLVEVLGLLPEAGRRDVTQIGIVSNTTVDKNDLPPGLQKFAESLGRPWGASVTAVNAHIIARLGETERWSDRCIHRINVPEEATGELVTLIFDYQRYYEKPLKIAANLLQREIAAVKKDALQYLETMAEGDMFDVDPGAAR